MKLSVCLATYNEEQNIARCLESVKDIADEIIVVDGSSTDKTVEIAKKYGAKVTVTDNPPIFHINKQKAIDQTTGDWVLQLDADEVVSHPLAKEIMTVIHYNNAAMEHYQQSLKHRDLFLRHQKLIEDRDGYVGTKDGEYVAFFFPRLNYFLGKFLRYGGVYPDGVIRLFKRGKAYLPAKDVHEQPVVDGKVGWLQNDLLHYDSPTFSRYIARNNRYINLIARELNESNVSKNLKNGLDYMVVKPLSWFFMTQLRHKGILDGYQGVIFSFFSALRFPRAYWRYSKKRRK
jgi:glycosyltransferase involved in cell wall biosynthesis